MLTRRTAIIGLVLAPIVTPAMAQSNAIIFDGIRCDGWSFYTARDTIVDYLEIIDYHDWQATMADACDMLECANINDAIIKTHKAWVAKLTEIYPEAAKAAAEIMEAKYKAWGEIPC